PLVGDAAEELAHGIIPTALVPVVAGDGNEMLIGPADDLGIGESERTARDAVVSGTAERMAVHFPKQDRLTLRGGELAGLPQIGLPADLCPLVLARTGLDEGEQLVELLGTDWLGRGGHGTEPEKRTQGPDGERLHGEGPHKRVPARPPGD